MSDLTVLSRPDTWYQDVPRSIGKQAAVGLLLMLVTFGGFGAWAMMAPLAAAVIAQGSFVATGQNKIVQHLEGASSRTSWSRKAIASAKGRSC